MIQQYRAQLNHKMLGLHIASLTFIKLEKNTSRNATEFEAAIRRLPEVVECCVLAGSHDYMLKIVTESLKSYERFIKERLANVDKMVDIESTIIINQVVNRDVTLA